jgi:hypothetical protein
MSRLLVENTQNSTATPATTTQTSLQDPLYYPVSPLATVANSQVVWTTPKKSIEPRAQLDQFSQQSGPTRTQRLLFKKVNKAFDMMDHDKALLQAENQALHAQLEAIKPRKRKRVEVDPNMAFASIAAIRRAQLEAGAVVEEPEDSPVDDDHSDTNSCIVVAGKIRNSST